MGRLVFEERVNCEAALLVDSIATHPRLPVGAGKSGVEWKVRSLQEACFFYPPSVMLPQALVPAAFREYGQARSLQSAPNSLPPCRH